MTEAEKLDAVYRMLRAQERRYRFRLAFRFFVLGLLVYFYMYVLPTLDVASLLHTHALPIIQNLAREAAQGLISSDPSLQ